MTVNAAIAEDLLSSEELDELFKISASESEPEDEDEDDEGEGEGEGDDGGEEIGPEDMPHG
jgi:hypothetical protein